MPQALTWDWQARTALLLSPGQMEALRNAKVLVFGLGGVGSYAAEALCRSGIGRLTLVDADVVEPTNLNRQLPALHSTLGQPKVEVVRSRLLDISPQAEIEARQLFYLPESPLPIPEDSAFVVDAVDTVAAKVHLAATCQRQQIPIISCMGMGNRLDPTQIRMGDLFDTKGCPLCRAMRRELRKAGIQRLSCVYSTEEARKIPGHGEEPMETKGTATRPAPGSMAYVPAVAGLFLAYGVVCRICAMHEDGTAAQNS